jgi:hypothetical protein
MSFEVSVLAKSPPTMLLDIIGSVTPADMIKHVDSLEAEISHQRWMQTSIYLIVDVQQADMTFIDALKGAGTHADARRGTSADPLTHGMFVGNTPMIRLLREIMHKQTDGNALVQIFDTREDALSYIAEHYKFNKQMIQGTDQPAIDAPPTT